MAFDLLSWCLTLNKLLERQCLSFTKKRRGKWVPTLNQEWQACTRRPDVLTSHVLQAFRCFSVSFCQQLSRNLRWYDVEPCRFMRLHWLSFPWHYGKTSFLGFEKLLKNRAPKWAGNSESEVSAWHMGSHSRGAFAPTLLYLAGRWLLHTLLKCFFSSSALDCVSGSHSSLSPALLLLFLAKCQRTFWLPHTKDKALRSVVNKGSSQHCVLCRCCCCCCEGFLQVFLWVGFNCLEPGILRLSSRETSVNFASKSWEAGYFF